MDLSPLTLAGLFSLPVVLIALGALVLGRWSARRQRRELDDIGRRLAVDEPAPAPAPAPFDAAYLAQLHRLIARAELKVGAFLARRRHGEVDLEAKRTAAMLALRQIVEFTSAQTADPGRDSELQRLLSLCQALHELATPREDDSDVAERITQSAIWDRLSESLLGLRQRLKSEFGGDAAGERSVPGDRGAHAPRQGP